MAHGPCQGVRSGVSPESWRFVVADLRFDLSRRYITANYRGVGIADHQNRRHLETRQFVVHRLGENHAVDHCRVLREKTVAWAFVQTGQHATGGMSNLLGSL